MGTIPRHPEPAKNCTYMRHGRLRSVGAMRSPRGRRGVSGETGPARMRAGLRVSIEASRPAPYRTGLNAPDEVRGIDSGGGQHGSRIGARTPALPALGRAQNLHGRRRGAQRHPPRRRAAGERHHRRLGRGGESRLRAPSSAERPLRGHPRRRELDRPYRRDRSRTAPRHQDRHAARQAARATRCAPGSPPLAATS